MEKSNKSLWVIVGIALGLVIAMLGMLIYNKYVDNKEDTNNKTEDKVLNNNQNSNIDLTGYTKLDISRSNIDYFFKYNEAANIDNITLLDGSLINFEIKNNQLYVNENLINSITKPVKIIIAPTDTPILKAYIINSFRNLYSLEINYSTNEITKDNFINLINNNIKEVTGIKNVSNISFITLEHDSVYGEAPHYLLVTINNKKYILDDEELLELSNFSQAEWLNNDGTIKDNIANSDNIKVKRVIADSWDKKYFIDDFDYVYMIQNDEVSRLSDKKIKEVYYNSNKFILIYEDNNFNEYDIPDEGLII